MKLVKCLRCELNYVRLGYEYCGVCLAELDAIKNKKQRINRGKGTEICSACNENPVLPGQELCRQCLAEKRCLEETEGYAQKP